MEKENGYIPLYLESEGNGLTTGLYCKYKSGKSLSPITNININILPNKGIIAEVTFFKRYLFWKNGGWQIRYDDKIFEVPVNSLQGFLRVTEKDLNEMVKIHKCWKRMGGC